MSPLPEDAMVKYVESHGLICPFCGSETLEGMHRVEAGRGDGLATQHVRCADCDKEWDDLYVLTGFTERDDPKDKRLA